MIHDRRGRVEERKVQETEKKINVYEQKKEKEQKHRRQNTEESQKET